MKHPHEYQLTPGELPVEVEQQAAGKQRKRRAVRCALMIHKKWI